MSFTMSRTKQAHYIFRAWVWLISLLSYRPPPNSFNLYRGGEVSFRWSEAAGTGSWPLGSNCIASYCAHRQLVCLYIEHLLWLLCVPGAVIFRTFHLAMCYVDVFRILTRNSDYFPQTIETVWKQETLLCQVKNCNLMLNYNPLLTAAKDK